MIGERIKLIRKKLNLTQKEFGDLLGIPLTMVSKYETGTNKPSSDILSKLGELKVNLNWLLTGEGEMFLPNSPYTTSTNTNTSTSTAIDTTPSQDIIVPEINSKEDFELEFALIPLVEAELSAGGGSFLTSEKVIAYYAFRRDWLHKKRINPKKAILMRVRGDSMQSFIDDKDIVLVDLNSKKPIDGKIFAIAFGESIFLKQIQLVPPEKILLTSENPKYKPIEIPVSDIPRLNIIGQVKWFAKELD